MTLHKSWTRRRRNRRMMTGVLLGSLAVTGLIWSAYWGPAYLAYWKYQPREGDIIFQSLPPAPLVTMIEGVSKSPFSHCGLVTKAKDGRWIVLEAYDGVETTPLREFAFRGREQGFAVYRLTDDRRYVVGDMVRHARGYLGRPYDVRYRMDDERIYCSELIFKAYATATNGESLGQLVAVRDLNWQPFEELIRHFEDDSPPLDRSMITPRDLAEAKQLQRVYQYNLSGPRH